jgi:hypothetical protein
MYADIDLKITVHGRSPEFGTSEKRYTRRVQFGGDHPKFIAAELASRVAPVVTQMTDIVVLEAAAQHGDSGLVEAREGITP